MVFCFQTYDYQDEKMSINEKIENLEQKLLDEISKLSPGILPKSKLRPIGNFPLEVNCIFILRHILTFKTLHLTFIFRLFNIRIVIFWLTVSISLTEKLLYYVSTVTHTSKLRNTFQVTCKTCKFLCHF